MEALAYSRLDDLAHGVHALVTSRGWPHASPRPWAPARPNDYWWWITPAKDWPAYHAGKFFFTVEDLSNGDVFCGIEVEKGFGEVTEPFRTTTKQRRKIMRDDWTWHRFLREMADGTGELKANKCIERLGSPINLRLDAIPHGAGGGLVDEPYASPIRDRLWFRWDSNGLVLERTEPEAFRCLPAEVSKCESAAAIAETISRMPALDWAWLCVFIGAEFQFAASGERGLDAEMLFEKLLSPWTRWFG